MCTNTEVISGKVVRKPASIAQQRVNRGGDPIAACKNTIHLLMVAWGGGVVAGGVGCVVYSAGCVYVFTVLRQGF